MVYLIITDLHANVEALTAVLEDAKKYNYEKIICLGDVVDYGAEPNEVIEMLRKENSINIMGNHDAACVDITDRIGFSGVAEKCSEWSEEKVTGKNKQYLKSFLPDLSINNVYFVHGTPMGKLWQYMDGENARKSLEVRNEQLILCGHLHEPFYFQKGDEFETFIPGEKKISYAEKRTVVCLPSVGQPRDENKKTGYALLDLEKKTVEIKRIDYEVDSTAEKIEKAGLPKLCRKILYS